MTRCNWTRHMAALLLRGRAAALSLVALTIAFGALAATRPNAARAASAAATVTLDADNTSAEAALELIAGKTAHEGR